jgi:hypothetical protein
MHSMPCVRSKQLGSTLKLRDPFCGLPVVLPGSFLRDLCKREWGDFATGRVRTAGGSTQQSVSKTQPHTPSAAPVEDFGKEDCYVFRLRMLQNPGRGLGKSEENRPPVPVDSKCCPPSLRLLVKQRSLTIHARGI